jgi:type IV secretory pathway TraG/TraD family ATPase VirD4
VLVHGYLRKPGFCTVVIIDPHGDFAEEVAKFRENRDSDRLIFIDPYLSPGYAPTVNPLYLRDRSPQNVDITAQALVDAFKQILDNTSLTVQMEALLVPCLTVLLLRENSTLIDLQRFLNDEKNDDLVALGKQSQNPAQRLFFRDRFYERTFAATKASISTKLQSLLNSQTFYHLTVGPNTVDIEAVLNEKKLVVFNLAKGKLGSDTSEAFGRFLLALMQSAILKRAQSAKGQRVPVHLFIDEFQNYISPSIAEILAESRKYGLHLTMAQQYLGQQMDTDFRRGILANTQVKMTGMSANDSRAAIAKETGIGESDLAGLGKGQFYVKVGNRPAFKLYVPSFLIGTKHAMAAEDWQTVKTRQLEHYYRRLSQPRPAAPDNRGGDPKEYEASKTQAEAAEEEMTAPKPHNAQPVKPKFTFEE